MLDAAAETGVRNRGQSRVFDLTSTRLLNALENSTLTPVFSVFYLALFPHHHHFIAIRNRDLLNV